MTEAERIGELLKKDPELYARKLLKIKTKTGEIVKLKYNKPQQKIEKIARELEEQGKPVRLIVLKARQEGISTWTQSRIFHGIATNPNTNALTIAHIDDSTTNLYRMSQMFYEELPSMLKFSDGSVLKVKPEIKYSNRYELVFKDLRSQVRVATAGSKGAGRSDTLRYLHCSEVAFWPDAGTTMLGLLQALADGPGTFAVVESTPNGVGDYFHSMWLDAKAGRNDWTPVFIAWFELEEYSTPFESETEKRMLMDSLDDEEIRLLEQYNLTFEQLNWRRKTIANKCNGSVELFHQEYPSNDAEAFLVSGRPFFDREALMDHIKTVRKGVRGNLVWANSYKTAVKFVKDSNGYIEFWKEPDTNRGCYAIGADVAEGLEEGDFSTAEVYDRNTGEQVAEWHGHIDPDLFGEEVVKLAIFYNRAWVGIEVNNHGLTAIKAALGLNYNRLYKRETAIDERHSKKTDKVGWQTTSTTRPIMLDDLATAIRERSIIIHSEKLLSECMTFVRNSKGKPEAQAGCNDDTVMASAIAIQVHKSCPMNRPISKLEQEKRMLKRQKKIKPISSITGY